MLDAPLRAALAGPLDAAGRRLAAARARPTALTAAGWVAGVGACVAAGFAAWPVALVLWLGNRLLDGLDGPVARATAPTDRGGFLDLLADFSIYAGFVVGVAVAEPAARLACVALLAAYYVSGTAFLTFAALGARRGLGPADGRSVRFVGGLAEGSETIVVYVLFTLLPGDATVIAWVFSAAVGITALQRVGSALRALRTAPANATPADAGTEVAAALRRASA